MERTTPSLNARIRSMVAKKGLQSRDGGQVYAYANHGRWVADCSCNGAELADEAHPMLCGTCGLVSEVVWPDETAKIERLLADRPVENQNWLPGEPVVSLAAENEGFRP